MGDHHVSLPNFAVAGRPVPESAACLERAGCRTASAEQKVIDVIARTEGAVVAIARVLPGDEPQDEEPGFGRRRWRDPPRSAFIPKEFGSGVIVRREPDDGLRFVLTPRHVISGRSDRVASRPELVKYQVRLASRHTVPGTLYNQDERSDLAVLQLELNAVGSLPRRFLR